MEIKPFKIKTPKGERLIGPGQPVFIVAEMSGNHNQSFDQAVKIIDDAAEAGADAVKIQTYTADTLTIDSDQPYFRIKSSNSWSGQTLYELYQKAYTPWDWQPKLKEYAERKGLIFFSTPFDDMAVDFLEKLDVPLYKVASFEIVDIPLLKKVAQTKKPVILSRGMSSVEEIQLAISTLKENGCPDIAILHCISSYPAKTAEMNLATIPEISVKFGLVSGLSDHSLSDLADIGSVALGAGIIEKHLTLSRAAGGHDAEFSLEPAEFKNLVKVIRNTETAIGRPNFEPGESEKKNLIFRKSLFAVENIKKGESLTAKNIRSIRPGYGLKPKYYEQIIGKTAKSDIKRGTPLNWDLIE